jgi:hypothetical protein
MEPTTGPLHFREATRTAGMAHRFTYGDGADPAVGAALAAEAQVHATQAQTAALVLLIETVAAAAGVGAFELDAWRDVIPAPALKECKGREIRRPACADRHTEDCAYADPPPEPKHVLLPIGTRVLVSDLVWNDETRKPEKTNPEPGRIVGYDLSRSKYQWQREWNWAEGRYSEHVQWAFADNRVEVHPDGPECPPGSEDYPSICLPVKHKPSGGQGFVIRSTDDPGKLLVRWGKPGAALSEVDTTDLEFVAIADHDQTDNEVQPAPEPVTPEPTGPRVYVRHMRGKQGHILAFEQRKQNVAAQVQWYVPDTRPVWVSMDLLEIITADEIARCPNGQTGDECGSGENRCELCLADEDNEADTIERSTDL